MGETAGAQARSSEPRALVDAPSTCEWGQPCYDSHGHLVATSQGSRTFTQGYDALGYLASTTDALGHTTSFLNDAVGRPVQTTLPDARQLFSGYDPDSNLASLTLPAGNVHDFGYTPVDLLSAYTPPSLGSGSWATDYGYDLDRRPTLVTRPDGVTIASSYDAAGRLAALTTPRGVQSYAYSTTNGQLASITTPGGEKTSYLYNGFLRTDITWSGPVGGNLSFVFDNNFRVFEQGLNYSYLQFGYDADGLMTQAGSIAIARDPQNGRVTGTKLGSVTDAYAYDANGLFASYVAEYAGAPLYAESVQRDNNGRITEKSETIGSTTTHTWGYSYDASGRLTDVSEDGQFASHYAYDADDNSTTYTSTSGSINPTYDAQDRLLTYGAASYAYTADGELQSKTDGSGTTSYAYDAFGNLLSVGLPAGTTIGYIPDGENRRVGKSVNGTLVEGLLYQDGLHAVAQLDGHGNLVARFVFGSKPNVPDYLTSSAGTFRILSDHLGSPRLVVNVSTGAVAEEIDYDEFGRVTGDTSPGLTPFGFAGGLYEPQTGLVRFGARDYDASVGRWTSKDPKRFAGGSMNLYGYVVNDPVNRVDPSGHGDPVACLIAAIVVEGLCLAAGGPPLVCRAIREAFYQHCVSEPPGPPNCNPDTQCCQSPGPAPAPGCQPPPPPPPPICP